MNLLKFFESSLKTDAKWVLFEEPLEAHEIEVLRQLLKKQKRDFVYHEIKADGVSADLEAAFSSLDFFSTAKVFYIHIASKAKWDVLSEKRWNRLLELSDRQGNWLFVSAEDTKKLKAPETIAPARSAEEWLKFFNVFLSPNGEPLLSEKKINFLLGQAIDSFLDYMHWIELWNLGGDDWAEHALGWGDGSKKTAVTQSGSNPAYDWVDAALAGRKDAFLRLSQELIENKGEDPLRLWGLLGKSIKISAQLGMGENVMDEAPFIVSKLKRIKYRPELLDWWCRCDLAMKSTRADVMGLIGQIPA